MTNLNWLTLSDIYSRYLDMGEYDDGTSALEFIEQCQDGLAYEKSMFESFGAKAEDRFAYEMHTKPALTMIRNTKELVLKWMVDGAAKGCWFAFGRRHPDSEEEMIPSRYWPFLKLDIKNGVATGHGTFRALRGLIWEEIPKGHLVHGKIRDAERIPQAAARSAEIPRAQILETSATPLLGPDQIRDEEADQPSLAAEMEPPASTKKPKRAKGSPRLNLHIADLKSLLRGYQERDEPVPKNANVAKALLRCFKKTNSGKTPLSHKSLANWLGSPEGKSVLSQRYGLPE